MSENHPMPDFLRGNAGVHSGAPPLIGSALDAVAAAIAVVRNNPIYAGQMASSSEMAEAAASALLQLSDAEWVELVRVREQIMQERSCV